MTMSMISSMTPDDFQNDEDVFGKYAIVNRFSILRRPPQIEHAPFFSR